MPIEMKLSYANPRNDDGEPDDADPAPSSSSSSSRASQFFAAYFWFILKNVIGWLLLLGSPVIGVLIPGPGGLPLFLIGFALITLPGKRRLTARTLRGRQLQLQSNLFYAIGTVVSLLVPLIGLWILNTSRFEWLIKGHVLSATVIAGLCVLAAAITWFLTRLAMHLANVLLHVIARARRTIRPWLRKRGILLLPARRRHRRGRGQAVAISEDQDVIEIHQRHFERARRMAVAARPWLRRAAGFSVAIAAWVWILEPLTHHWWRVHNVLWSIGWLRVAAAVTLLALSLALFRALAWRKTLLSLGVAVPLLAAMRIWCTIELARYVPGGFASLAGRIGLARPYGLDAALCTASHAIELALFFLANTVVATGGLIWFAASVLQSPHGMMFYAALALLPVLLVTLHPSIFYRALDLILRGLGLGPMQVRLASTELLAMFGWMLLGLGVQVLAIWILFAQPNTFALSAEHLPLVASAYALGWCVGTAVLWVPAGIGVGELVFVKILLLAPLGFLGPMFSDTLTYFAMLALMSIVLRFWNMAGDAILALFTIAVEIYHGGRTFGVRPSDGASSSERPQSGAPLHL